MLWLPWCVPSRLASIYRWEQRDSARAQIHCRGLNSTGVNTVSRPLFIFTHETVVPPGVLCQNSWLYVINMAALEGFLHWISGRRDVQRIDCGGSLFNEARRRETGIYWLFCTTWLESTSYWPYSYVGHFAPGGKESPNKQIANVGIS